LERTKLSFERSLLLLERSQPESYFFDLYLGIRLAHETLNPGTRGYFRLVVAMEKPTARPL
jgi:hypothetical protein